MGLEKVCQYFHTELSLTVRKVSFSAHTAILLQGVTYSVPPVVQFIILIILNDTIIDIRREFDDISVSDLNSLLYGGCNSFG